MPFEFLNQEKGFSIRQKKVERMIKEKKDEEERALSFEYRAREIPKSVKGNKYEKLMASAEKRKDDAKRFAMAKIKSTEKPFAFYERDVKALKDKMEKSDVPTSEEIAAPFRAGKIPWRVLVPMYQAIIDKDDDRDKRVKKAAEISLSLSKLPPRMEAYEKLRKEKEALKAKAGSKNLYMPPKRKEVPDFKRKHKEFASMLEKNKSASKLTVPQPFHFHESKPQASLRKHLDDENQTINPTMKKRSQSVKFNIDLEEANKINPPTTKKHEALVALRRQTQTEKIHKKIEDQNEAQLRLIKAVRLTNRVKKSPALTSNQNELKQKRTHSL